MKKYLLIILSFIMFPCIVMAEETCENVSYDEYCRSTDSTCLSSLQSEYNTWKTTGNTGVSCIKVIAQIKGNTRSYLSGKNPESNYKCVDGSQASAEKVASAIPYENEVTDCDVATCYVPEIWKMDCGNTTSNSTSNNNSGSSNGGTSTGSSTNSGTNSSEDLSNGDNVSTNDKGQITGTTDASDTGVETYFIVLFIMIILSYGILIISKKKNIFKSI